MEPLPAVRSAAAAAAPHAAAVVASCLHLAAGMGSLFASFSSCLPTLPPRSCPTPELDQMMQQGIALMRVPEQWDQALQLFDRMVTLAPTFAEVGWGLGLFTTMNCATAFACIANAGTGWIALQQAREGKSCARLCAPAACP